MLKVLSFCICLGLISSAVEADDFSCSQCIQNWNTRASLDLLYWKACEKGVVLTNRTSPVFDTTDFTEAPVRHPRFDWDFGFRLGLGSSVPCLPLDIALDWTYYSTTIHQHQKTDSNDLTNVNNQLGMFPIWALSEDTISGDYVSEAKLKWQITLNQIDLKCTQLQLCCHHFDFRPYVGLRAAFINQNARIKYSGGIFLYEIIAGGVNLNGTDRIRMKNDFWGIGPKIGFEPRWNLCRSFSVFGNAGISGLIGVFDIHQKETYLGVERFSRHKHLVRLRWVGDLAAGIAWDTSFCDNKYLVRCQLSWEYHLFFHQLELKRDDFDLIPSNRNLEMQGVVLSANICF